MRLWIIWVILRKELVETLRDRKTLFRVLVLPVLIYPLLVLGLTKFEGSASEAREARASHVAVWGDAPPDLAAQLGREGKLTLTPWAGAPDEVRRELASGAAVPPAPPDDDAPEPAPREGGRKPGWVEPENPTLAAARAVVERREAEAVLVLWPGFREAVDGGREGEVSVYFDSVRADSVKARDRVERALRGYRKKLVERRERQHELAHGFAGAVRITARNVAPERRRIGQILGGLMPFLLVGMSLLGALYPAIDLTAGEKERGTMQTLLCAPVRTIEIILGKFLAVWIISLLMALANLVSLSATLARALGAETPVPASAYALTFLMLVPVTFLVSAIFLALAAFARDFKDGQNLLIPVYLPLYLLAGVTMIPGIDLDAYTAFVPVVNISLLIKASFIGEAAPDLIFLTLGSSILYAALALVLAARVFEREQVLLGSGTLRDLFRVERRPGTTPTPAFSFTAVSAVLVLGFYGSLLFTRWGKLPMILGVQYGLMLLSTVAVVLAGGFAVRETLALRAPPARSVLAALLLGPTAGVVVLTLVHYLAPMPERFAKAMADAMLLDGQPLWVLILALGVTPALCEELLFRGLVFSGFRKLGPTAAVLLSALLFAFAHASIYRLVPTFTLGALLGYTRLRSGSIVPGMILHGLNNGLAIALLFTKPAWAEPFVREQQPAPAIVLAAFALTAVALALLRSTRGVDGGGERQV
jgi:sodium transport system permease protein